MTALWNLLTEVEVAFDGKVLSGRVVLAKMRLDQQSATTNYQ